MQHIFLTGFMGSGKSTAGTKLATVLKKRFIDLDAYIEKTENRTIVQIFEAEGEEGFRQVESKCLLEICKYKDLVVSLGGGTVCFNNNLDVIKANGVLIYIELQPEVLAERIKQSKTQRPLLKNMTDEELIKNINEILSEREKYYQKAHITVSGLNLTPQLLQQKIIGFKGENIS